MSVRVNCENLNQKRKIDLLKFKKIAVKILRLSGGPSIELNVIFLSNQKIRAINRRYLKRDRSTDVISFDQKIILKGKRLVLGDIFISTDKAAWNAENYGTAFAEETALYLIHGILHIMGYEDRTKKEKEAMRRKENGFLKKIRKDL